MPVEAVGRWAFQLDRAGQEINVSKTDRKITNEVGSCRDEVLVLQHSCNLSHTYKSS